MLVTMSCACSLVVVFVEFWRGKLWEEAFYKAGWRILVWISEVCCGDRRWLNIGVGGWLLWSRWWAYVTCYQIFCWYVSRLSQVIT